MLMASGSFVLDLVPGATLAYSMRKLRSAYAGQAINVRRSSDNAQQDIGFVNGGLDTASLLAFCGAGNGFIVTWYDQSVNTTNITQATAAQQMQIVASGVVSVTGNRSRPVTTPTGSQWYFPAGNLGITGNPAHTCISVSSQNNGATDFKNTASYGAGNSTGANWQFPNSNANPNRNNTVFMGYYGGGLYYSYPNNTVMASHIWTHAAGASSIVGNGYLNGVNQSLSISGATFTPNLSNGQFCLGSYTSSPIGQGTTGYIAEYIYYSGNAITSAQASAIANNQNSYYGLV